MHSSKIPGEFYFGRRLWHLMKITSKKKSTSTCCELQSGLDSLWALLTHNQCSDGLTGWQKNENENGNGNGNGKGNIYSYRNTKLPLKISNLTLLRYGTDDPTVLLDDNVLQHLFIAAKRSWFYCGGIMQPQFEQAERNYMKP